MKHLVAILALLFALQVFSQVHREWVARYDGQNNFFGDWAYGIEIDISNNIYVTGVVGSSTQNDIGTIKYNPDGVLQWVKYYNGSSNLQDFGYDIAVDNNKNVYVTGKSYDTASLNFVIIKYDSNGTLNWVNRHYGEGNLIKINKRGDIVAVGNDGRGIIIVTYSKEGALIWQNRFEATNSNSNFANNLCLDEFNNIYIGGIASFNFTYDDLLILKMNSDGLINWYQTFNGTSNDDDYLNKIDINYQGNIYLAGQVTNSNTFEDYVTIKYNTNGSLVWFRTFNYDSLYHDITFSMSTDLENIPLLPVDLYIKMVQLQ